MRLQPAEELKGPMPSHPPPEAYRIDVSDDAIADLHERLGRTRYPEQMPGPAWAYGTDVASVRRLIAYWRDEFDWRAQEARLNAYPQYRLQLHGIDLHYLHVPGKGPRPLPLLLSHGWPGSVFEFLEMIPRLTDPARFGGDPDDAFTVVAPSLPGYGLSFTPGQERFGLERMTDCFADLMTSLGHQRFAAQGGDWGAFITSRLGALHPDRLVGIHLNLLPLRRPRSTEPMTAQERTFSEQVDHWMKEEAGYQWIQGTRPQTLAFALSDSPAGLAAWILEKFRAWSDCGGDVENAFSVDTVLANIGLYWFTGAIGSSFWPYYSRLHGPWPIPNAGVAVPTGYAEFPGEILKPPRSLAAKTYLDLRRWTVMERGGHFAALEQPEALAREIVEFFRPLRKGSGN